MMPRFLERPSFSDFVRYYSSVDSQLKSINNKKDRFPPRVTTVTSAKAVSGVPVIISTVILPDRLYKSILRTVSADGKP